MFRGLFVAFALLVCSSSAQAQTIVDPPAGFDITCGGQAEIVTISGCDAFVPYFIYFEYVNAVSGTYSGIGSKMITADSGGNINTTITVGTLAGNGAYLGRVRVARYAGANNPPVDKVSNSGTFRGNGP